MTSPFFENDPLFGELVSYARAAARRRGLTTLDRLSFNLGIGYALVTGTVKVPYADLQLPDESVLFAYAQSNHCPLVDLSPSFDSIPLEQSFADEFVALHVKQRSTLLVLLKGTIKDLIATLDSLSVGSLVSEFKQRQKKPFYYSIFVAAGREDFGLFLPGISVDINVSTKEKFIQSKARFYKEDSQWKRMSVATDSESTKNRIVRIEKKEPFFEIDFGSPLDIPFIPDGPEITHMPESLALGQNELRLYISNGNNEKSTRITRLPTNPDVWELALPPGSTLKSSAPIIRAAAARLFLLATVGRKKIEISNMLQRKRQTVESADIRPKLSFPFDTQNNVLGAYFAFCLAIVVLCVTLSPLISLAGFGILAWAVSRDVYESRSYLLQLSSRLGIFWGPQLGLSIVSLILGLWPAMANSLHVDFLSATLFGSIPLMFSFSLVAIDFQPKEEREALETHEEIHHALATHMHEISQTALSVALGNFVRAPEPHAPLAYSYFPEVLIKQLDKEIGTIEAVDAFKRLVSDRIKTTETAVKKAHEGQQHARRTVMAAGGAVFTGYFAFEAGEKVIEFQNLQSKCDIISFYHWNQWRSPYATPEEIKKNNELTHPSNSHTASQVPGTHVCDSFEDFNSHHIQSTGLLLLATLVVSLLAAIVTIRKPNDEHGGGGHH